MKKHLITLFKWLFARFLVKQIAYQPPAATTKPKQIVSTLNTAKPLNEVKIKRKRNGSTEAVLKRQFNPGVRIMTHNEHLLYNHYPNLQKWYNYFGGQIPDILPELNFKPK